jgi:hypothetical protein
LELSFTRQLKEQPLLVVMVVMLVFKIHDYYDIKKAPA